MAEQGTCTLLFTLPPIKRTWTPVTTLWPLSEPTLQKKVRLFTIMKRRAPGLVKVDLNAADSVLLTLKLFAP